MTRDQRRVKPALCSIKYARTRLAKSKFRREASLCLITPLKYRARVSFEACSIHMSVEDERKENFASPQDRSMRRIP